MAILTLVGKWDDRAGFGGFEDGSWVLDDALGTIVVVRLSLDSKRDEGQRMLLYHVSYPTIHVQYNTIPVLSQNIYIILYIEEKTTRFLIYIILF